MGELPAGTVLHGAYCVERLVAVGGMSRLYRGYPLQGAGLVAIKQLDVPEQGDPDPEDLEQFLKEYRILHGLDHGGLARVLDFFEEGGRHYLVEEFVPGDTLETHLEKAGRFSADQAVDVMEQILDVLAYLHGHDVIYRDLKPQNIIVQPGTTETTGHGATASTFAHTVRLVDFGAARRWRPEATRDTVPLGTPGFAAPEQYGKSQSDARSDVYSAGVLLHYLLTGNPPDPSPGATFEPPHARVPQVPVALGEAVLRAVHVDPRQRFPDAKQMRRAIRRAMGRLEHCPACGYAVPAEKHSCPRCDSRRSHASLLETVIGMGLIALLAFVLIPNKLQTHRQPGRLTDCIVNLKDIGTALAVYATNHAQRYPPTLDMLTPQFLETIPTCPSAGEDTYSNGFISSRSPDAYTLVCGGMHHAQANQRNNYPQYTSTEGLISQ